MPVVVVSKLKPNGGAAGRLSPGPVLSQVKAMRGGWFQVEDLVLVVWVVVSRLNEG